MPSRKWARRFARGNEEGHRPEKYEKQVYILPKHLYEKVARLHLERLGMQLTELLPEQAEYIGIDAAGPFESEHYRY